jgi:hypothetical protein
MTQPIVTMSELEARLSALADGFRRDNDRLGYFAALYQVMTAHVREGIAGGRFEDGPRMERLACHFASRYLDALQRRVAGETPPLSWAVAFDAGTRWRPVILQHLFLGMNAHINFDLGIAAAELADDMPNGLPALLHDFDEINTLLAELQGEVQRRIGTVSPWMRVLDFVGGRTEEHVLNFSMQRARDAAWREAEAYAPLDPAGRAANAEALDARVAHFARVIVKPGRLITFALLPARLREDQDVGHVIAALQGRRPD